MTACTQNPVHRWQGLHSLRQPILWLFEEGILNLFSSRFLLCFRNILSCMWRDMQVKWTRYTREPEMLCYIHAKLIRNPKISQDSLRTLKGIWNLSHPPGFLRDPFSWTSEREVVNMSASLSRVFRDAEEQVSLFFQSSHEWEASWFCPFQQLPVLLRIFVWWLGFSVLVSI